MCLFNLGAQNIHFFLGVGGGARRVTSIFEAYLGRQLASSFEWFQTGVGGWRGRMTTFEDPDTGRWDDEGVKLVV